MNLKSITLNSLLFLAIFSTAYLSEVKSAYATPTSASLGQFDEVYYDRQAKVAWSRALPQRYSNGCEYALGNSNPNKCNFQISSDGSLQVKSENSAAAKACSNIGARLPTLLEFESLIRNFHHAEDSFGNPHLVGGGMSSMLRAFREGHVTVFWTSTVASKSRPEVGVAFTGYYGKMGSIYRSTFLAVRCVVSR